MRPVCSLPSSSSRKGETPAHSPGLRAALDVGGGSSEEEKWSPAVGGEDQGDVLSNTEREIAPEGGGRCARGELILLLKECVIRGRIRPSCPHDE